MTTVKFAIVATCILLGVASKCYYLGKDVWRDQALEALQLAKTWEEAADRRGNVSDLWKGLYYQARANHLDSNSDMKCMLFNYVKERHDAGFATSEWGLDWNGRVVAYAEPQPLSFHDTWYAITPEPIQGLGIEHVIRDNKFEFNNQGGQIEIGEFRGPKETGAR